MTESRLLPDGTYVTSTQLKMRLREVKELADEGVVYVTEHGRPEYAFFSVEVYDGMVPEDAVIRSMQLSSNNIHEATAVQMSLFQAVEGPSETELADESARQKTILDIKAKFGKNSLLRGTDLMPKATQRERNQQIGGHKSGE